MKRKTFNRLMVGDTVTVVREGSMAQGNTGIVTGVEYGFDGKPVVLVHVDTARYGRTTLRYQLPKSLELSQEVIEMNYQSLVDERPLPENLSDA